MYVLTQARGGPARDSGADTGRFLGEPAPQVRPAAAPIALDLIRGFGFNRSELPAGERPKIDRIARVILSTSVRSVLLVGHTDPVGTPAYNLALGRRRADEAARHLRTALDQIRPGVSQHLIIAVESAGETRLVSKVPAENRRVEVFLFPGPPVPPARTPIPPTAPRPPTLAPYVEPFPNIKKECPWEHGKAMDALLAMHDVKFFEALYKQLHDAASNASLSLSARDELVLNPDRSSFLKLLEGELASELAEELAEGLAKRVFSPRVARLVPLLDLLGKFAAIHEGIRNKELVNEQRGRLRDEAFRRKLSLLMDIKARLLRSKDPIKTEAQIKAWLWHQYWRFDERSKRLLTYRLMDESHCYKARIQPTMRPAPPR
jgi:outer membrane protein OmpA-like peptidoglycan-associated protein